MCGIEASNLRANECEGNFWSPPAGPEKKGTSEEPLLVRWHVTVARQKTQPQLIANILPALLPRERRRV